MQITLQEAEFTDAIGCWLREQGFDTENYNVEVKIIPGRKFGTTVEVSMTDRKADIFATKTVGATIGSGTIDKKPAVLLNQAEVATDSMAIQADTGLSFAKTEDSEL